MQLRDYQIRIANEASVKLINFKIVYLAMEVRCGKTLTALETAKLYSAKSVLFITKKRAISSIESDYKELNYKFDLMVVNYESLHLVNQKFDLVICDESHSKISGYPKPSETAKLVKEKCKGLPVIFLSGTPTPESYSQIYHQLWVSDYSPFREYKNFYKWAKDFVNVTTRNFGYADIKDYTDANQEKILQYVDKLFIRFTQQEAGFISIIKEQVLYCNMSDLTYNLCSRLKKDKVVKGEKETILADTGVKLMSKLHQLFSGTIIFESGKFQILDDSKGKFIKETFLNMKIGIFYKFKAEYQMLKQVFGDSLCDNLEEFNSTDKNIALQIVSGREGISLKKAKCLVYLNIDFSATSYWQSRDRLTTIDRRSNEVFWVFADNGIENLIYKSVLSKRDYTLSQFNKDISGIIPAIDYKIIKMQC